MRPLTKFLAIGTLALASLSLVTWVVVTATGPQSPGSQSGNNDVTVCVGPDSVLRSPESGICPKGTTRIALSGPDLKKLDATDENDPLGPAKKAEESKSDPLADLERRISNLENSYFFGVVNKKGNWIFSVSPEKVLLYNENETPVSGMLAFSDGGEFVAQSADAKLSAFIGAYAERAGIRLTEGDQPRLELLKQVAGNYSFKIPSVDGAIAGIGESKAGTGALVIGDFRGRPKASMTVNDGKGAVSIFNGAGNAVSVLSESVNSGGLLVLTDANSYAMVKMGTNYNRYGVVMTFPPGFPLVPRSGLPGSYFMGCASGPSCVP